MGREDEAASQRPSTHFFYIFSPPDAHATVLGLDNARGTSHTPPDMPKRPPLPPAILHRVNEIRTQIRTLTVELKALTSPPETRSAWNCQRCGHNWIGAPELAGRPPKRCPACSTSRWRTPREGGPVPVTPPTPTPTPAEPTLTLPPPPPRIEDRPDLVALAAASGLRLPPRARRLTVDDPPPPGRLPLPMATPDTQFGRVPVRQHIADQPLSFADDPANLRAPADEYMPPVLSDARRTYERVLVVDPLDEPSERSDEDYYAAVRPREPV